MPDDKPPSLDPAASKTFCVLPWIHSYFATDGQAALCCISPAPLPAPDHGHYNIQHHAMRDIFHSPAMDDVRRQLLEGKQIERCSACYSAERVDAGLRTHFNELWQKKMPGLMEVIKERQVKPAFDKPLSVDIRFGNLCNLQCQICNPHNSTQIERDPVLSKWNDATYLHLAESRFKGDAAWYESPMFEDELAEATTGLRYITLGGGEPSISKPAIKWLERLIESGRAEQIEIHVSTNISNVNPRFFDLAAQFGKTQLYLSIDGFGPLNEYLRYPSKWRIVERNVNYISELARQGNFEINITPVISAYNALAIAHFVRVGRCPRLRYLRVSGSWRRSNRLRAHP
jgi:Radical SAM superfamily/Iron-sulfur cluster-binding domain